MATLTVWKFDTPGGAEQAVNTLESLVKQQLIKVHEAFAGTGQRPELLSTNLSGEQEAALRDMLAG